MGRKLDDKLEAKISDLEERVKEARGDFDDDQEKYLGLATDDTPEEILSKRISSEFLGTVIAGFIFGAVIDRYFETAPWGLLFFIIMGFVAGVYRANDATKKNNEKS